MAAVAAAFEDSVRADGGKPNLGKCKFWGANRAAVGHGSIVTLSRVVDGDGNAAGINVCDCSESIKTLELG